uniref:Fe2OG dioxygenase domain-containing protein n=1 Tax=Ditylenchus dipsaci TaxID=166011 RepID=A0A915CY61_9BILA
MLSTIHALYSRRVRTLLSHQMHQLKEDENFDTSEQEVSFNLDDFLVGNAPSTIHYIPGFLSLEEEEYLLEKVNDAPKPKWVHLANRRLQQWGGLVGKRSLISDGPLPFWLSNLIDRICQLRSSSESSVSASFPASNRPNHVLINEYTSGQGIMPHTDGPAFFPLVSTISLGSHTLLDFYEHVNGRAGDQKQVDISPEHRRYLGSMHLEPRSLILIRDHAYSTLLHGIEEKKSDVLGEKHIFNKCEVQPNSNIKDDEELERSTRISLTIRNVPLVNTKLLSKLIGQS